MTYIVGEIGSFRHHWLTNVNRRVLVNSGYGDFGPPFGPFLTWMNLVVNSAHIVNVVVNSASVEEGFFLGLEFFIVSMQHIGQLW